MEIKIVTGYPEKFQDASGTPQERPYYSFTVDGVPSLKWYPECNVPGLPKDYYVQRCLKRLQAGRSAEAFGSAPAVAVNGQVVALATASPDWSAVEKQLESAGVAPHLREKAINAMRLSAKQGRGEVKPIPAGEPITVIKDGRREQREQRPKWTFLLDGQECGEEFPSEQAARAACAMKAFLTRHKVGQIPAALAKLQEEFPGRECKVWACGEQHGICATVDGEAYSIGWVRVGETWTAEKFKKIEAGTP